MSQMIQTGSACLMLFALAQVPTSADDPVAPKNDDKPSTALSVPLLEHIEYPDDRPEWITEKSNLSELPHRWVVVSGPSDSIEESKKDLKWMVNASIETYMKGLPGAEGRSDFFDPSEEWVERRLVAREYQGEVTQGGTTRYESVVELKFDRAARTEVLATLKNEQVRDRLGAAGVVVFLGLAGLICSSALLGVVARRVNRSDNVKVSTM